MGLRLTLVGQIVRGHTKQHNRSNEPDNRELRDETEARKLTVNVSRLIEDQTGTTFAAIAHSS